ncbi:hypothetical protein [Methylobacillus sp.]|uniref:hypothetical protein n=1 Tax=Methylobacillus sp. TaxID=56818 RepID=UPI00257FFB50|nr:hypothetical protein [Methylobacillus sp.]
MKSRNTFIGITGTAFIMMCLSVYINLQPLGYNLISTNLILLGVYFSTDWGSLP